MSLEGKSVEEIQALAELASTLSSDPKTRRGFLTLTKAVNPNASIPEIDIPMALREQFKEPLAKLDALEKAMEERKLKDQIEASRRDLIRKTGVREDDLPAIEKLMVEKGIANHETAVEHYRMQQRSAEPTPASTEHGLRRFEKPSIDLKPFGGDPDAWSRKTAYDMIDDLKRNRAPTH